MKTYMNVSTQEQREELAGRVDSTVGYFWQLAGGHKKPGTDLCHRLVEAEPRLTLHELRPDVWKQIPVRKYGRRSTDKKT